LEAVREKHFPFSGPNDLPRGHHVVVFNIGGGAFRLITVIHYNRGIVFVWKFMTHAEYSKEDWKNDP
jgi:mRNA-degrading endonuclease HigB of HigAB toxin-antitoxin module